MSQGSVGDDRLHSRGEVADLQGSPSGPRVPPDEVELASQFRGRLRVFACRRLNDPDAAEDVAQETLRRVIEALRAGRLENPAALPAFVFQTARNVCLHRHRSSGRESRALARLRAPGASRADGVDPLAALISEERGAAVRAALDRLGDGDRDLLRIFYYEGATTQEIARRLDLTAGAVRVRKHRALRRLESLLGRPDPETAGHPAATSLSDT